MLAQCSECDHQVLVPHSCGHRHCPHCQHHESQQWLERQLQKPGPADDFLVTFTLPEEFRSLTWQHQRTIYALMTRCSWETVRTLSQNDPQLHGTPGAITLLHTPSRCLDDHPPVHLVMPAAAVDQEKKRWRIKDSHKDKRKKPARYLFNHQALAKVFRAKRLDAIRQEELELPLSYPQTGVVDVKSVGTGEKALIYLGRYLYKGVIQEKEIIACDKGQVTFRYQNSKTQPIEYRTVSGPRFLGLILPHGLPKGFRRARNFGFLHAHSQRLIALLQSLRGFDPNRALAWLKKRPKLTCPRCAAVMNIVQTRIRPLFPVLAR
jgi:hypothetical protein